jgi:hypothetical protein
MLRSKHLKGETHLEIKEKTLTVDVETTVNVGNFENFRVKCGKSATYSDATPEEEKELHKELFKEAMDDLILEANYAIKVLGKEPSFPFPKPRKKSEED